MRGRNDAALMDELVARYLIKTRFLDTFKIGKQFDCVPIVFMFSKNAARKGKEINKILQDMKTEGIIDNILEEYR
jgi:ABC-type amino acid transport substrate-binding protein